MKRINHKWGVGSRQTLQQVFAWGLSQYPYPIKSHSVAYLRYERAVWTHSRKHLKRDIVGSLRCMGAKHFFKGCYLGAEND
jgi:hypothetical protein